MNKKIIISFISILLIGIGGYALTQKQTLPVLALQSIDNQNISLTQNKRYLINFWATNCPGCIKEMPDLVKAYQDLKQKNANVEFVAIAMSYDNLDYIKNFVKQHQLPFKVVYDANGQYAKAFGGVQVTPTTFIIDSQGKIAYQKIGEMTYNQFIDKMSN